MTAPIGEDDLHAYVDGFLDPDRRSAVERYLGAHPEAAARVAGWQAASQALRDAVAWKGREPVPEGLSIARLLEARVARPGWAPWQAAASGAGWFAHGPSAPQGIMSVGMEAVAAQRVFASDPMRPVEFGMEHEPQMVTWLSDRLGRSVSPPDLSQSGYRLVGGRLLATQQGPACMFLYSNSQGDRITLFIRPMEQRSMNAPMQQLHENDATGFVWAHDGLGIGLVGSEPMPVLHTLSTQVWHAM
jgi:anti-sigma factor RsiW